MSVDREVLDLFKVMVITPRWKLPNSDVDAERLISRGVVVDFVPTATQERILSEYFKPLDIRTLFTRQERDNADPMVLIHKQVLHYFEVYGLDTPGLFNLEVSEGNIITLNYVKGVSRSDLESMVSELLYTNAPVKNSAALLKIIEFYDFKFNINLVANNELRVALFNPLKHTFTSGDDAVRYMCWAATGDLTLIKSKEVINAIRAFTYNVDFLERHTLPLANVFNRHKRLIMAAKNVKTRSVINRISRLSKTKHVPVIEHVSKRFISEAIKTHDYGALSKISVRDKLKFLNLLAYKKAGLDVDTFIIRNGKLYTKSDRKILSPTEIRRVKKAILNSLEVDLAHLKQSSILLDSRVAYGLPTSRKQTIGQLPFGTTVSVKGRSLSSGIYWENEGGARDLDLSTVDTEGNRTGWGQYSGYDRGNPVTFSGDVVDASDGAMEFMTSSAADYGLFVNIYNGSIGCEMELVVGQTNKEKWIEETFIREKHKLESRGSIVGFVKGQTFVVYSGRLSNGRVSGAANKAVAARGMSDFWTVNRLFDELGIHYDLDRKLKTAYTYELEYENFSYDKLEDLLLKNL